MSRIPRITLLLVWLVLGLALILLPWTDAWDTNYFLFQFPAVAFFLKNPYLRGAISGLGFMNVLLSLEGFRHHAPTAASRT
jgi:hypothetical protein